MDWVARRELQLACGPPEPPRCIQKTRESFSFASNRKSPFLARSHLESQVWGEGSEARGLLSPSGQNPFQCCLDRTRGPQRACLAEAFLAIQSCLSEKTNTLQSQSLRTMAAPGLANSFSSHHPHLGLLFIHSGCWEMEWGLQALPRMAALCTPGFRNPRAVHRGGPSRSLLSSHPRL